MRLHSLVLFSVCLLLLTSCVIPVYQIVEPGVTFIVKNENGQAMKNASVSVERRSYYPGRLENSFEYQTDETGTVSSSTSREWDVLFPLFLHGIPSYWWTWCVEAPGYRPVHDQWRRHEFPNKGELPTVVLEPQNTDQQITCKDDKLKALVPARGDR